LEKLGKEFWQSFTVADLLKTVEDSGGLALEQLVDLRRA